MMNKIINWLRLWSRRKTYKAAVKKANTEHAKTVAKVLVVLNKGAFVALTKKRLKQMRKAGTLSNDAFKRIEKIAVYVAK